MAGDPVRAVIRNTGVNQDGKTHGITLPNEESQAFLASQTYAKASMNPAEVDYIEAHGTGTAAGDLAEVNAIAKVFGKNRLDPLLIGSIKSNIGHLEACSGLAGLIKAVLVLEKGEIPPTINHETPRPELKLHERNIKVCCIVKIGAIDRINHKRMLHRFQRNCLVISLFNKFPSVALDTVGLTAISSWENCRLNAETGIFLDAEMNAGMSKTTAFPSPTFSYCQLLRDHR